MQVLRVWSFSAFSLPPAFPPCSCPLTFRSVVTGEAADLEDILRILSWFPGVCSSLSRRNAGSRTFTDYQRLCQVLAPDRHRIAQVITGGARGADQLGYRWAWKHQVRHQLFRAEWEHFGKSAGMRRNHQMAQAGDVLVAFWDGQSPGTAHMVQCMRQLGKPVVVIRTDGTA